MTTKKNSLLFKITLENEKKEFQINEFIDFFLEGGLFESYLDQIYGIATHNFNLNIFNVTFKETTAKSTIEDLYETFKDPQLITIRDEINCSIQINRPLGYRQLITLYPMPFDVNFDQLKAITMKWGNLKNFEFGRHKKCPLIHNSYLHLYIENFNHKEIPDQFVFRNRFIAVNVDGEPIKTRCNYCKKTDHLIEDCPFKTIPKNNQPSNPLPQPKQTYAKTITSTPKRPQPPILHPSTQVKLVKQNIKKNTQNFPPLSQNPTTQTKEEEKLNLNPNLSSLNITQEEAIKSFDETQSAKMPLPSTSKPISPQTPAPINDSLSQKRKLSPSPSSSQSSSISIELKPRKKKTNTKEKYRKNSI